MESLYKSVGMEVLPDEFLPDDYTGPSAGPLQEIIRTYTTVLTSCLALIRLKDRFSHCTTSVCYVPNHLLIDRALRNNIKSFGLTQLDTSDSVMLTLCALQMLIFIYLLVS